MSVIVTQVASVTPHGENLSIVETTEGHKVIANKRSDGSFRWSPGEIVGYVSEGSILPEDVLKERGYWDTEKDRGLLDGGKRNRVKMKKLAGFESRGLLFKAIPTEDNAEHVTFKNGEKTLTPCKVGDDITVFFDITEFKG